MAQQLTPAAQPAHDLLRVGTGLRGRGPVGHEHCQQVGGYDRTFSNTLFRAEFTVSATTHYVIRFRDTEGHENRDPVRYDIVCRKDQPPAVTIARPGRDVELPADGVLDLTWHQTSGRGPQIAEVWLIKK
jgi:hypothetical protein